MRKRRRHENVRKCIEDDDDGHCVSRMKQILPQPINLKCILDISIHYWVITRIEWFLL